VVTVVVVLVVLTTTTMTTTIGVYTYHPAEGLRAYLSDLRSFFNAECLPSSPDVGLPTVRKNLAQIDQSWMLAMEMLANIFQSIFTNILKHTAIVRFLGVETVRIL